MEPTLYTICAVAGGVLVLLQVLLQALGMFGEVDMDADAGDVDGVDVDGSHGLALAKQRLRSYYRLHSTPTLAGILDLQRQPQFGHYHTGRGRRSDAQGYCDR